MSFGLDLGSRAGVYINGAILTARNENLVNKNAANLYEKITDFANKTALTHTIQVVDASTGKVLTPSKELSADEIKQNIESSKQYYKDIISKGADKNDLFDTLKYAGYDAMFDVSGKDTVLKKLAKLDNASKDEFLKFIKMNPVALTTPYGESELSELFLDDISIKEFKEKWSEFSKKSMAWARANPRDDMVVIDTSIAPNYTMTDTGEFVLESGDPDSDYQIGGLKLKDLKARNAEPNEELSQEEKQKAKQEEIDRNNRMLMRKYNGAKSRNLSLESKNEILKTFFEEYLKNNNPLAFLEFMKKTDIRA